MSGPRQRPGDEPDWCVKRDHDQGGIRRHASEPVRVGDRRGGGQVTALLIQANEGPLHVLLIAAHMASASAEIEIAAAAKLRDGLTTLLEQAGWFDR